MRPRSALLVLAPLLAAAIPALAADDAASCAGFAFVPGQGPSCPESGAWRVVLADGSSVVTHGPDPILALPESPLEAPAPPAAPDCVEEASSERRSVLVYAAPFDRLDRSAAFAPVILASFLRANALVAAEGAALGFDAKLKVLCGAGDVPVVRTAILGTRSTADGFWTIVSDLRAAGYDRANEKYWIYYDDGVPCGCSGQGTIWYDDRADPSVNRNNRGPSWGIAYTSSAAASGMWHTLLHENGHNLGAVQLSAPHASGGFHCNDGVDVMCYADGGATSAYTSTACPRLARYDCGSDDYFHPAPAAGSYLATRWNVARSSWLTVESLAR